MVKYPNYLSGSQDDINKRLLHMILKLEKGETGETADITALKNAVGDNNSGLIKDVADIKAAIGASDTTAGSLKKRCKDIEDAIGTDDNATSVKGRIYKLEHPTEGTG